MIVCQLLSILHSNCSIGNQGYKQRCVCGSIGPLWEELGPWFPTLPGGYDRASSFLVCVSAQILYPSSLESLYVFPLLTYSFSISEYISFWWTIGGICSIYTCAGIAGSLHSLLQMTDFGSENSLTSVNWVRGCHFPLRQLSSAFCSPAVHFFWLYK